MIDPAQLIGVLTPRADLIGEITVPQIVDADHYMGPYEVTPRLSLQYLETAHKLMTDDVTIHEIPVTYTSNPYDGKTVLIG